MLRPCLMDKLRRRSCDGSRLTIPLAVSLSFAVHDVDVPTGAQTCSITTLLFAQVAGGSISVGALFRDLSRRCYLRLAIPIGHRHT
jgi:hypothetical protein